jgi:hypothetical protein
MLLFRSEEEVEGWCRDNGVPKRPLLSLEQLWVLAVEWYRNRLTVDSRRPDAVEMVSIFERIGLAGPFWNPASDGWKAKASGKWPVGSVRQGPLSAWHGLCGLSREGQVGSKAAPPAWRIVCGGIIRFLESCTLM